MKLDKKNFIFNFQELNHDQPFASQLFKQHSWLKKTLNLIFSSWLAVIAVSLFLLCGKIAAEDFATFVIKVYHH